MVANVDESLITLFQLLSQLNCDRKVLLTGTPVQNDLKEFFHLADFVNPGIFGSLTCNYLGNNQMDQVSADQFIPN